MIAGIVLLSMFTAQVSSRLTTQELKGEDHLFGKKVRILRGKYPTTNINTLAAVTVTTLLLYYYNHHYCCCCYYYDDDDDDDDDDDYYYYYYYYDHFLYAAAAAATTFITTTPLTLSHYHGQRLKSVSKPLLGCPSKTVEHNQEIFCQTSRLFILYLRKGDILSE